MVGGGLAADFNEGMLDDELIIRSCQCSALMPSIQFSYPMWISKNPDVRECMRKCLDIREKFTDYIMKLAREAAVSGIPIVRYMEYEFPHSNLENVATQFMLGDTYLVAPVLNKGQTQKRIYFPPNTRWREFGGSREFGPGVCLYDVNLQSLPIFERIG